MGDLSESELRRNMIESASMIKELKENDELNTYFLLPAKVTGSENVRKYPEVTSPFKVNSGTADLRFHNWATRASSP